MFAGIIRTWPCGGRTIGVVLVLALIIQAGAGFTFRGLYADGAPFVTHMLSGQSFVYAPSRWMSSVIFELPVVLAIKLGIGTPDLAALIFSVSTNVIPGALLLLSGAALPANDRRFFVFPAFVYFAGTLAAQFASVTEGLVATSYVWLLFYLILFGRLSGLRLSLILFLSIGGIRLHEEMSFLGPVLIAATCLRWRNASPSPLQAARVLLGLALVAMLASAAVGAYWVLFPYASAERAMFVAQSIQQQWWLYVPGSGCNLPAALGVLAAVAMLACIAAPRLSRPAVVGFGIVAGTLALASFWLDILTVPAAQFYARHNAAFMSFPLMFVVIAARVVPGIPDRLMVPSVQQIVAILGITVSLWHVQATEKWTLFLSHFRTVLASHSGIIASVELLQPPGTQEAALAGAMIWSWTNPDLSILVLPRRCIASIVDQPQPVTWYYDLKNPGTLPQIPGVTYTYLLPLDRQASCPHVD